jgi:hypothetical protein
MTVVLTFSTTSHKEKYCLGGAQRTHSAEFTVRSIIDPNMRASFAMPSKVQLDSFFVSKAHVAKDTKGENGHFIRIFAA